MSSTANMRQREQTEGGGGFVNLQSALSDALSPARLQPLRITMERSWCHFKDIGKNIYIELGQRSRLGQEFDTGLGQGSRDVFFVWCLTCYSVV